jgi:SAM-dependent methyltransferase
MTSSDRPLPPPSQDAANLTEASAWVKRFAHLVAPGARLLDLASGGGRHARFFAARGAAVLAVDRDDEALAGLAGVPGIEIMVADLEGEAWPLAGRRFDAIVVTRYLHRPRWPELFSSLADDGVLIYETFGDGNERFGRPARPEFLLHADELLEYVRGRFAVVAFEQGEVRLPKPAVMQRICAVGMKRGFPQALE